MPGSYQGTERRTNGGSNLTRDEWERWCIGLGRRLDDQDGLLGKLTTAMFAKDEQNEFESPGVMTTMQRLNRHIDVMCSWAVRAKRLVTFILWFVGGLGTVAGAVAAAKAAGWIH